MGARIAALLAAPDVSRAHWGVAVMALDGTPLYGFNEGQFFRPASNAKLFTSVAATAMLGLDRRFSTQVVARGDLKGGKLHGDLILRGGGDANFAGGYALPYVGRRPPGEPAPQGTGLADFDDLAAQIAAKGVREIDGDVIGDDTRFEYAPYPAGWAEEDVLWGYGAPVSALIVHDNQLDLKITPAPEGSTAKPSITLEPAVPFYTVNATPQDGHMLSVGTQDLKRNEILEDRQPYARDFHISGFVDAKYGPFTDEFAIDQPAAFAAAALRQALEQHGVTVKGSARAQHGVSGFLGSDSAAAHQTPPLVQLEQMRGSPELAFTARPDSECQAQRTSVAGQPEPEETVLAEKQSVPFSEDLKLTLKVSQNLHAETMLRNVGVNRDCMTGVYLHTALAWERAFLLHAGLDGADFEFFDGSGLSAKDIVTPRAIDQLLLYASQQPWFATWKDALPVGGEDGTLRSRFPEGPLRDHLFAKTGTLGETRALSGYLQAASGKTIIFSVMVDTHSPGDHGANTKAMDAIVAAIAENQ
jgi:D-alanyl-D-alanine carboxypeptidase/D-alanyl-D-alanine-endopeptidase (penicillin-binding protein 4)